MVSLAVDPANRAAMTNGEMTIVIEIEIVIGTEGVVVDLETIGIAAVEVVSLLAFIYICLSGFLRNNLVLLFQLYTSFLGSRERKRSRDWSHDYSRRDKRRRDEMSQYGEYGAEIKAEYNGDY